MPITHLNRKGRVYYLHRGLTKTGKDKFFVSTKLDGELAARIPDGFEIYENPDAQVFLRKKIVTLIRDEELDLIRTTLAEKTALEPYQYKLEIGKETVIIHLIDEDPTEFVSMLMPFGRNALLRPKECADRFGMYSAMMRLTLTDAEKRLWSVERFCFKGSVDDWIYLAGPDKLKPLAGKFLKHLGKDSFFDLM